MTGPLTPDGRWLLQELDALVTGARNVGLPVDPARVPDGPALDRAAAAGGDRTFLGLLIVRSLRARTGAMPHEVALSAVAAVLAGVDARDIERLARHGLDADALVVLGSWYGGPGAARDAAFAVLRAGTSRRAGRPFDLAGALAEEIAAAELVGLPPPFVPVWRDALGLLARGDDDAGLSAWVGTVGTDGWAWPAAGFTVPEARRLLALPTGHPERPTPEQLAVMAALRS